MLARNALAPKTPNTPSELLDCWADGFPLLLGLLLFPDWLCKERRLLLLLAWGYYFGALLPAGMVSLLTPKIVGRFYRFPGF